MKIIHMCLSNFYIEGFGYQENILPKYHKKQGHDVAIIASRYSYDKVTGNPYYEKSGEYINGDGIRVRRLDFKYKLPGIINERIKIYKNTYEVLKTEKPDLIFSHGIQFMDLSEVGRYTKQNSNCKLIADSHAAYINSAQNFFTREIMHKIIYKSIIKRNINSLEKIYMITPGCKELAKDLYKIPNEKMEYLYLGADTDLIEKIDLKTNKEMIRNKLNIKNKDFVFITGGKLSEGKNIKFLIECFSLIKGECLKLIIFGPLADDIKENITNMMQHDERIVYIDWVEASEVYSYFSASDCAIFPGTKSALWEQAVCTNLPLICKAWKGTEYIDVGGNVIFIDGIDKKECIESMETIANDKEVYAKMADVAKKYGYKTFSYKKIAERILDREADNI